MTKPQPFKNSSKDKPVLFVCGQCGATVTADGDGIKRECGHDNAPITASLTATAYGESRIAS